MIGRWRPSRDSPMTIGELVDDIIRKVKTMRKADTFISITELM